MNKKLLFLVTLVLFVTKAFSQLADVNINPNFTFNGEQSLVVNPNNPNHLVVAWMKVTQFSPAKISIATSYSMDGGLTWSSPVNIPHFRSGWTSADPTLTFKNDGTVYLGYIDFKTSRDSGAVYVTNSTNNGQSWNASSKVVDLYDNADLIIDRPWMAIDNSGGTYNGKLYMVTKSLKEDPLPHHIYLMSSSNNGATWSAPKLVDDSIPIGPSLESMGIPAVNADGRLIISYLSYAPSVNLYARYINAVSNDGGNTLNYKEVTVLPASSAASGNDTLLQYSYNIAANPANANSYILSFTDRRNGDWDILSTYTNNNGSTWSAPVRINDDAVGNGNAQDMVWASFSGTGKYAAAWRDRRANSGAQNLPYKIFGAYSSNGGQSFSSNLQLSQTDGPLQIPIDGNDFLGCAVSDTMIYTCWADKRASTNQLYFNRHNISSSTALHEVNKKSLKVYPNPANSELIIQPFISGNYNAVLYNIAGQEIFKKEFSTEIKINTSWLKEGTYMLEIKKDEKSLYKDKIQILH